jgi:hypothetical protein
MVILQYISVELQAAGSRENFSSLQLANVRIDIVPLLLLPFGPIRNNVVAM